MAAYTSQLHAGIGMVEETYTILDLWQHGMDGGSLYQAALQSGRFPNMSARRLRNFIAECFMPRYVRPNGGPALLLRSLKEALPNREVEQLLLIFTCRVNPILTDFVREVYWNAYISGRTALSNEDARAFVLQANQDGKTSTPWSDHTIQRVARYLTACCADFGLLERGTKHTRKILPYRIEPRVAAILAYDLHFAGHGDNQVLNHGDWALFGLDSSDVLNELKRLALMGFVIVQAAGNVTRIGWQFRTMEEVTHAVARR